MRRIHFRAAFLSGASTAVVVALVVVASLAHAGPPKSGSGRRPVKAVTSTDNGCKVVSSFQELQAVVPFALLVPDSKLASDANVTALGWCPQGETATEEFESGVDLVLSLSDLKDPTAAWQAWQTDSITSETDSPGMIN